MARLDLLCFILAGILLVQAMADNQSEQNPSQIKVQNGKDSNMVVSRVADQPTSSHDDDELKEAQAPEIRRLGKHHSSDKSVAGGGVIIGGLVTAIFAAVFFYIRVTRKKQSDDLVVH